MVYLVIIVVVAAAGLGRLWWIQRRHATSLSSVDGFRSSLERLAGQQALGSEPAHDRSTASRSPEQPGSAPTDGLTTSGRSSQQLDMRGDWASPSLTDGSSSALSAGSQGGPASDPYLEPLDPERRAAAKRRLEARRRGAVRSDLRSR
ncbi:MAG: hypothetical protein QOG21_732 [Actinomycetota bacterium]|nr:hypothetical protein [Actinomycetota bacterium]